MCRSRRQTPAFVLFGQGQNRFCRFAVLWMGIAGLTLSRGVPHAQTVSKTKVSRPHSGSAKQSASAKRATVGQKRVTAGTAPASTPPAPNQTHAPATMPPHTALPLPVAAPVITYFNQDAKNWLRPGETVYVTMQGTSGGQATFRVGTLTGNVAMRETTPGQYLGSWVVPVSKGLPITPFVVTGELRASGKMAEPMPASRPLQIDALPPVIANTSPQETTSATPNITADLSDAGSGIDIASLHLRLNGRDITGSAQVTADHIAYTPMSTLSEGEQVVEIEVSDRAGNKTMQMWHFTVKL